MKKTIIFQVFVILGLCIFLPGAAQASDMGDYIWGPPSTDIVQPYLEGAKIPHNARWADDVWSPQDWIDSRNGNALAVVNGFYTAEIVTDQYFDDDVPVLEVGQGFLELGAQEKRRVVKFMDEVYGVTAFAETPVILIYFYKGDELVGVFTEEGLQLQ